MSSATDPDSKPLPGGRYLFYRTLGLSPQDHLTLPSGYSASMWWPSRRRLWPSGVSDLRSRARFAFRFLLDRAGFFSNCEVGALCIHHGHRLVHYSGFTPRYWRFPFLPDADLQIGDTWTDPAHRGRGLASYAVEEILEIKQRPDRRFWYVVGKENFPSIRVVERARFELVGVGEWRRPLGLKLLGSYIMEVAKPESLPIVDVPQIEAMPVLLEAPPATNQTVVVTPSVDPVLAPIIDPVVEPVVAAFDTMDSAIKRTAA